jgi:hypothetical protein
MSTFTEAEAKTKTCCGPNGTGATGAAMGTSEQHKRFCLGSACMGWRSIRPSKLPRLKIVADAHPTVLAFIQAERFIEAIKEHRSISGLGLTESKEYCDQLRSAVFPPSLSSMRGYCGLAGKP